MNFDDSLLTAYLDGDLTPERRLTVESVLLSSPRLSARLAELTRLRDVLDGLPRPRAPIDFSPLVLGRVRLVEARRRRLRAQFRRALVLAPITAAAAGLLVAFLQQGGWQRDPAVPTRPPLFARVDPPQAAAPGPDEEAESVGPPAPASAILAEFVGPPEPPGPARPGGLLGELMEGREVRRIVLRVDQLDEATLGVVGEAIRATPRSDPRRARFRVPSGVLPSGEIPDEAAVFAVALDDAELARFRTHLADRFPAAWPCESAAGSRLLAALAVPGRLEVVGERDRPAATLVDAGGTGPELNARLVLEPPLAEAGALPVRSVPEAAPPPVEAEPTPSEATPKRSDAARVYLVWVVGRG